jgi:adenine deaminase
VAHDKHNIWVVGSSDAAMAAVVNRIVENQGGWALVTSGAVVADVRYEAGGLMTRRPAEELDAEMRRLYAEADKIEWLYEPTFSPRWFPAFRNGCNRHLTCAPWRWVLVAPTEAVPQGFVNVQTGQSHPVVW